jgi:hypothetical protein
MRLRVERLNRVESTHSTRSGKVERVESPLGLNPSILTPIAAPMGCYVHAMSCLCDVAPTCHARMVSLLLCDWLMISTKSEERMGGAGSGRYPRPSGKITVDVALSLDVRALQRTGLMQPGSWFVTPWANGRAPAAVTVEVQYSAVRLHLPAEVCGVPVEIRSHLIKIESTPCHFGGHRLWFACPTLGCGRRSAILYFGRIALACRTCCELSYQSQRERAPDRALRRAQGLRRRLGGSANVLVPFPGKPLRMHWRTYEVLRQEAVQREAMYVSAALAPLGRR